MKLSKIDGIIFQRQLSQGALANKQTKREGAIETLPCNGHYHYLFQRKRLSFETIHTPSQQLMMDQRKDFFKREILSTDSLLPILSLKLQFVCRVQQPHNAKFASEEERVASKPNAKIKGE